MFYNILVHTRILANNNVIISSSFIFFLFLLPLVSFPTVSTRSTLHWIYAPLMEYDLQNLVLRGITYNPAQGETPVQKIEEKCWITTSLLWVSDSGCNSQGLINGLKKICLNDSFLIGRWAKPKNEFFFLFFNIDTQMFSEHFSLKPRQIIIRN